MMDYKAEIIKLINKLNASDETFLKQVYIIIKKHFDRREGRQSLFFFAKLSASFSAASVSTFCDAGDSSL